MYSFSLLYKELQKIYIYIYNPFSYMLVCICMHVCVCILTPVFGYLVRISFIPQIAKLDNRKKWNTILFSTSDELNEIRDKWFKKKTTHTINLFLLFTTHFH